MSQLYYLPFPGANEVFSIFGKRDLNGDGVYDNVHGGWDVRKPKVNGVVPIDYAEWPCDGAIDWKWDYDKITSSNDNNSYGIARRIINDEGDIRCLLAHMSVAYTHSGKVHSCEKAGRYGPNTTGNSGGIHAHVEFRVGGASSGNRCCPGELYGLTNTKDVIYDRDAMDTKCIGYLDCDSSNFLWRLGPSRHNDVYRDVNNKAKMYTVKNVIYRVYNTASDNEGFSWYQITPGRECILRGSAPVCWVRGDCGTYESKMVNADTKSGFHFMKIGPMSSGDFKSAKEFADSLKLSWEETEE